ncbi:hypothetical protein CROQUDRAFT_102626 [Cronartium quercuum f. sp. fusiforme G11]|uniref:Uncharacterized protein n=1 Tax=Cronartium quercuum f. sp. fusiforme G11 TaxID=708437 RepID=A0A9P6N4P1_9BASI|nr:hypothetical protein CROQUDRAFT_102626 [Cronartium quercuum f. sp. fusiforme G11]
MHPQSHKKLHTHHIWKKGSPATSIKALNASVASLLPTANDAISCSLALFTHILLNINQANKTYLSSPTPEEHQQLPVLTQSKIMHNLSVFTEYVSFQEYKHNTVLIN